MTEIRLQENINIESYFTITYNRKSSEYYMQLRGIQGVCWLLGFFAILYNKFELPKIELPKIEFFG